MVAELRSIEAELATLAARRRSLMLRATELRGTLRHALPEAAAFDDVVTDHPRWAKFRSHP